MSSFIKILFRSLLLWIFGSMFVSIYALASPEDSLNKLRNLHSTGQSHLQNSQYENALESFEEALGPARELGNEGDLALVFNNIGLANFKLGRYEIALNNYNQALRKFKALSNVKHLRDVAQVLENIGLSYLMWGKDKMAIINLEKSLVVLVGRKKKFEVLAQIGHAHRRMQNYEKSIRVFNKALEISEEENNEVANVVLLNNLGNTYRTKET